jgi:hypothetical protein
MKNMVVMSKVTDLGLTEGRGYEVLEESCGYYKIIIDNGNKTWRKADLFLEVHNAT